jgi:hypothetical protein
MANKVVERDTFTRIGKLRDGRKSIQTFDRETGELLVTNKDTLDKEELEKKRRTYKPRNKGLPPFIRMWQPNLLQAIELAKEKEAWLLFKLMALLEWGTTMMYLDGRPACTRDIAKHLGYSEWYCPTLLKSLIEKGFIAKEKVKNKTHYFFNPNIAFFGTTIPDNSEIDRFKPDICSFKPAFPVVKK